jgi:hypothetical protein
LKNEKILISRGGALNNTQNSYGSLFWENGSYFKGYFENEKATGYGYFRDRDGGFFYGKLNTY